MTKFWETNLILKVLTGSRAYGTATEDSDIDTRGICIPPSNVLLGLDSFEQYEHPETDEIIYSLDKFVRLALQNNPNIMEILYSSPDCILEASASGKGLLALRDKFLSKQVFKTYGGYVRSRVGKLERQTAEGKRKDLIDKFGYDTKDAAHVLRLQDSCVEALNEGTITVKRPNADFLRAVRRGEVPLDSIYKLIAIGEEHMNAAYTSSKLPDRPDRKTINEWLIATQTLSISGIR